MDNYGLEPDYNGNGITRIKKVSSFRANIQKGLHDPLTPEKPAEGPIGSLTGSDKIEDSKGLSPDPKEMAKQLFEKKKRFPSSKNAEAGKRKEIQGKMDLTKSIGVRVDRLRKSMLRKQQVDNKNPKLFLDQAIASIDQVLGKLDGKHRDANEKVDTVDGIPDTTVQSYDVWSAGTPNKQGKAIDGDKKKTK